MHMIRDAADAIAFAFGISCDRRKVGMQSRTDGGGSKKGRSVLGAEDDVNEQE